VRCWATVAPTEHSARLPGTVSVVAGLVAVLAVAVDGAGHLGGGFTSSELTIYGPGQALLAGGLIAAGIVLMLLRRRDGVAAGLVVAALCAAQLASTGLVGFRRWPLFRGASAPAPLTAEDLARSLALLMAAACAVAALGCLVSLVRGGHLAWRGGVSVAALATAAVVASVGPLLLTYRPFEVRELAAWSLMYGLPYAAAVTVSGLVRRPVALVAAGAVAACSLVATAGTSMLELIQPWGAAHALVLVAAVTVVVAGTTTSPRTPAG